MRWVAFVLIVLASCSVPRAAAGDGWAVGRLGDDRPVWSPDGRWISFSRGNVDVLIRREGGRANDVGGTVRWSPTGKAIVIERSQGTSSAELAIAAPERGVRREIGPGTTPDWSSDGRHIVFSRFGELYVADASARRIEQLSVEPVACEHCESREAGARWSPDGERLVFVHEQVPSGTRLALSVMVAAADGTGLRQVRRSADDSSPEWSPDGRWIAFIEDRFPTGQKHVWVASAAGDRLRELARGAQFWWSPRSDRIAYVTEGGEPGFQGVRIANLAGRRVVSLSGATSFTWAPDGRRFAFVRGKGVYAAAVDAAVAHRVGTGRTPAWSPDGPLIAYAGPSWTAAGGIYVVRPSGSGRRRLTGR